MCIGPVPINDMQSLLPPSLQNWPNWVFVITPSPQNCLRLCPS